MSRNLQGGGYICVGEVATFEEQRLSEVFGQSVGEAIGEVEPGGVAAAFTKVTIRLACDVSLAFGDGFDGYFALTNQIVEFAADDGVADAVDHHSGFNVIRRRDAAVALCDGASELGSVGLTAKDGDDR